MSGGTQSRAKHAEGYHPACTRPDPTSGRGRLADTAALPSPPGEGTLDGGGLQAPHFALGIRRMRSSHPKGGTERIASPEQPDPKGNAQIKLYETRCEPAGT